MACPTVQCPLSFRLHSSEGKTSIESFDDVKTPAALRRMSSASSPVEIRINCIGFRQSRSACWLPCSCCSCQLEAAALPVAAGTKSSACTCSRSHCSFEVQPAPAEVFTTLASAGACDRLLLRCLCSAASAARGHRGCSNSRIC